MENTTIIFYLICTAWLTTLWCLNSINNRIKRIENKIKTGEPK